MGRSLISLIYLHMEVVYKMEVDSCFCCFFLFFFGTFSNFGAQMVAWLKGFQEISAFVSARTGFGLWDLDKVSWQRWIVANFFSLHSWMGLICISLFGAQVWSSLLIFFTRIFSSSLACGIFGIWTKFHGNNEN